MSQIQFFAVRDDLVRMLRELEMLRPLKYTRMGFVTEAEPRQFFQGEDIPQLGKADADSAINCSSYLVSDPDLSIQDRTIRVGTTSKILVDQLVNPDTMVFSPGGVWDAHTLLSGRLGTVSTTIAALELTRAFAHAIGSSFQPVGDYYVGAEAMKLFESGARLTLSIQSPREFDLVMGR